MPRIFLRKVKIHQAARSVPSPPSIMKHTVLPILAVLLAVLAVMAQGQADCSNLVVDGVSYNLSPLLSTVYTVPGSRYPSSFAVCGNFPCTPFVESAGCYTTGTAYPVDEPAGVYSAATTIRRMSYGLEFKNIPPSPIWDSSIITIYCDPTATNSPRNFSHIPPLFGRNVAYWGLSHASACGINNN